MFALYPVSENDHATKHQHAVIYSSHVEGSGMTKHVFCFIFGVATRKRIETKISVCVLQDADENGS